MTSNIVFNIQVATKLIFEHFLFFVILQWFWVNGEKRRLLLLYSTCWFQIWNQITKSGMVFYTQVSLGSKAIYLLIMVLCFSLLVRHRLLSTCAIQAYPIGWPLLKFGLSATFSIWYDPSQRECQATLALMKHTLCAEHPAINLQILTHHFKTP